MSELSPEQAEKLVLFKEVTSYGEDDHDKVIRLLNSNQWNLEIAIPRFFDGNFDEVPIAPLVNSESTGIEFSESTGELHNRRRPSIPQTQRLNSPFFDMQDNAPRFPKAIAISENWKFKLGLPPRQQAQQGAISPLIFLVLLIPRTIAFILSGIGYVIDFIFPGFTRLFAITRPPNSFPREASFNEIQPHFQSFADEVTAYQKEDQAINENRVIFYEGEYNNAYDFAKTNLKWLMLVLVNDNTKNVLKRLTRNNIFKKFNDKNDVILWGGNVDYIEAFEVGRTYHVNRLPALILIANVSRSGEFPLMSVVHKVFLQEDFSQETAKATFKKLQRSIDIYEPQLISQRYDKQEQELSRRLRREQDDAYNKSLLNDKLKMEAKLAQKRKEEEELIKGKLKEEVRLNKIKLREKYLITKSIELLTSYDFFEKGNHTTMQFRLNTGERLIQKFLSTKTLFDVFLFIDCKLFLKNFEDIKDDKELLDILRLEKAGNPVDLQNYEHDFNFDLIQPFPRFVLEPRVDKRVGDVKEIWPNGNLLVEFDLDDGEDDEEE